MPAPMNYFPDWASVESVVLNSILCVMRGVAIVYLDVTIGLNQRVLA